MYAKVFCQILDSSLAEDWKTRHVFEDLLKLAGRDGVVDMTYESISRRLKIPLPVIRRAIAKLSQPDAESRSPAEEGRRLVLLDTHRSWGWRIVNYETYRNLRTEEDRREYNRRYMREYMRQKRSEKDGDVREKNLTESNKNLTDTNSASAYTSGDIKGMGSGEGEPDEPNKPMVPILGTNTSENGLMQTYRALHGTTTSPATVLAKIRSALSYGVNAGEIEAELHRVYRQGIKAEIWDVLDPLVKAHKQEVKDKPKWLS